MQSKRNSTIKLAKTPTKFQVENIPQADYLAIPEVSAESREYIPIAFLAPTALASNKLKIIQNASLYHFGILTSSAHNAWVRSTAGRLKSDISYSSDIVYNNFPWPEADNKQKSRIEVLGQKILDTRSQYPNSSLADLYNPLTMPKELLKAHRELDRAVLRLYGLPTTAQDADIVARLFELYKAKVQGLA